MADLFHKQAWTLVSGCVVLLFAYPQMLEAAKPQPRRIYVQDSDTYPVESRSPDPVVGGALLKAAEDSCQMFLNTMELNELENFSLILEWDDTPQKQKPESFDSFPRKARMDGGKLSFRIQLQGTVPEQLEQIYRSCMTCYLQSLGFQNGIPEKMRVLPEPPLWISEGLTQMMMKSRHDTYFDIVRRYRRLERLPELKTVQGWTELSGNSMEARWQQAFCYWLLKQAVQQPAEKRTLVLWLSAGERAPSAMYLEANRRTEGWWQESAVAPSRSFSFYDWDTTLASLAEVLQVGLTAKGETESRVLSLAKLPDPTLVISTSPVRAKLDDLALLEVRAHVIWAPVIALYRAATTAWLESDIKTYQSRVDRTLVMEREISEYMKRVRDYLDYATVNYPADNGLSEYASYRDMVHSLENSRLILRPGRQKAVTHAE